MKITQRRLLKENTKKNQNLNNLNTIVETNVHENGYESSELSDNKSKKINNNFTDLKFPTINTYDSNVEQNIKNNNNNNNNNNKKIFF